MTRYKKRRLYQLLVEAGFVKSKKDALDIVRQKKVLIEGKIITSLHYQVNPKKKRILVDGKLLKIIDDRRYFVFHKPKNVETTKENILEFFRTIIPSNKINAFYPVGRLDKNTEGLLIVTNDGRLGNKILNPKSKILKTYETLVEKRPTHNEIAKLSKGVEIIIEVDGKEEKYLTKPCKANFIKEFDGKSIIEVIISEGKKRQVRKMFEAIGYNVISLKRTKIGDLKLESLEPGKFKEITSLELDKAIFHQGNLYGN